MTADVYADDDALREGKPESPRQGAALFNIVADADADVMVRVSAALNLLNVAPRRLQMETSAEGTVTVRALVDCARLQAELVARKLQQLTSVRAVTMEYVAVPGSFGTLL